MLYVCGHCVNHHSNYLDFSKPSTPKLLFLNTHHWIPWSCKHTIRHQKHLPGCYTEQDMATFVFRWPSWQPFWSIPNKFLKHNNQLPWPWIHSLRKQSHLASCSRKWNMATFDQYVKNSGCHWWQPSWIHIKYCSIHQRASVYQISCFYIFWMIGFKSYM